MQNPEFSLKTERGGHLGTYQWSHPLEEVDTLPIIDVVCLATLRGTYREGDSQASAHQPDPTLSDG